MNKYSTLIFDLDDTLIDNEKSVKYAFLMILNQLKIKFSNELFEKWLKFDISYWHIWESGKMLIPDIITSQKDKITYLRANRFILFFKELNLKFEEATQINDLYCNMLGVNIAEIEGANNLLEELSFDYEILIATNGPKSAALNKVKKVNLDSYISYIISSEDVGFSKPMSEFFNYLCIKCQTKDKSKMLLIGDSLTTDIQGGMNNGIDTCWFNPKNNPLPQEFHPTMTINKLLQLKKKL